jgi:hypothetical protein
MVVGQPIAAEPNVDDYEHAIGLRSSWSGLTENIAEPAQWIEGTHRFVYRKTVPGGFQFVVMDAETKQKQPAFDHDRLATALGTATGKVSSASTMQVVNALIEAHKDFDLLVVPNEGHGVFRSTGDVSYGLRRQYDFFVRHLRQEPTPDWNARP